MTLLHADVALFVKFDDGNVPLFIFFVPVHYDFCP